MHVGWAGLARSWGAVGGVQIIDDARGGDGGVVSLSRLLHPAVHFLSIDVGSDEELVQLDTIETQQRRELPLVQQFPAEGSRSRRDQSGRCAPSAWFSTRVTPSRSSSSTSAAVCVQAAASRSIRRAGECTGGLGASIAIQVQRRGNNGLSGLRAVLMPTAIQRR